MFRHIFIESVNRPGNLPPEIVVLPRQLIGELIGISANLLRVIIEAADGEMEESRPRNRRRQGCMSVLPGSHLGRTLEHEDTYHQDNMLTRGQAIKEIDEKRAVSMPLKAGEMSIHNYCLAHGSGPNSSGDRRIGVSMHFMPPQTKQVVGSWDCAALVRGKDRYGHFVPTPVPARDFDPVAVAFHAQAAKAMRDVLYAGAEKNLQRL